MESCQHCHAAEKPKWWKNKLFLIFCLYVLVFVGAGYVNFLRPLQESLFMYLRAIALPILIGLFVGGIIDWLIPGEYISALLAPKRKRTIIYSVITGFFMSACSHGILALAIQLHKKGASPPAVVSFLLASPWANLPLTILMFGFFGIKALFIVFSAVIIAIITGYIYMFLAGRNWIEKNPNTIELDSGFSIIDDAKMRLKKVKVSLTSSLNAVKAIWSGSLSLANMVLWWILFGAFFASLAAAYLPSNFMHQYMGATILGLLVTLAIATVIEICSEGSAPLAFEIYRQTGALGNAFTFLMAGVVTDYTEIGLIWQNIGWRSAVWLPIITVPQVILLAVLANLFL